MCVCLSVCLCVVDVVHPTVIPVFVFACLHVAPHFFSVHQCVLEVPVIGCVCKRESWRCLIPDTEF